MPAAYKSSTCRSSFKKIKAEGIDNPENMQKLLFSTVDNLKDSRCALQLNYKRESLAGYHYSFTQLFNGIPIYQSEIKINTDKVSTVHSLFDNSYSTLNWSNAITNAGNTGGTAVIAINPQTNQPVLAQRTIVNNHLETITANGQIIFQTDINCYFLPPDSLAYGKVFNPDPLTTAQQVFDSNTIYYSPQTAFDGPWQDAPWLDEQQQLHSFTASYNNGIFSLQSPYVILTNYDTFPPDVPPVTSTTGQFFYNRSQSGFQDVNAFYHICTYHNYVHGLGFNCADSLVYIDTHAIYDDNSYFSWATIPGQIYYGVGGVPDAEDADVVVHEYCHSISYTAAPQSNVGNERRALDEGFCDYNAASYSRYLNTFNDQWVYNWDGHNNYWPGRVVNSTKTYPADLDGSIYDNGEIWSAALFSLNSDIGRGAMDSLIIQAHYSYAENMAMSDAAQLLIDADTLLSGGANYCPIFNRLLEHGFVPASSSAGCAILPTAIENDGALNNFTFMQHGNSFTLMNGSNSKITLQLLDITGRQVAPLLSYQDAVINYENPNLVSGIYIVNVLSVNGSASSFKWCKVH